MPTFLIHAHWEKTMSFYQREFVSTQITPKQHLLEYHSLPFICQHGFGQVLHSEQGGEETHAVINRLTWRAWGMKNEEDKLHVIMTEHMLKVSPMLQSVVVPVPTTQKKKISQKKKEKKKPTPNPAILCWLLTGTTLCFREAATVFMAVQTVVQLYVCIIITIKVVEYGLFIH